ncbi:unnamed protein product [Urochloa humidicola]
MSPKKVNEKRVLGDTPDAADDNDDWLHGQSQDGHNGTINMVESLTQSQPNAHYEMGFGELDGSKTQSDMIAREEVCFNGPVHVEESSTDAHVNTAANMGTLFSHCL